MRRILFFVLLVLGVGSAVAHAAPYPPLTPTVGVGPSSVNTGASFVVTFSGYQANENVSIDVTFVSAGVKTTIKAVVFATPKADGTGGGSVTLTAPGTTGKYSVTGTGVTSGAVASSVLSVTAQASEAPSTTAAPTTTAAATTTSVASEAPTTTAGSTATTVAGGLPRTGADTGSPVRIAIIAVIAGLVLVIVSIDRRRRATSKA